jgi:hypothetical protein
MSEEVPMPRSMKKKGSKQEAKKRRGIESLLIPSVRIGVSIMSGGHSNAADPTVFVEYRAVLLVAFLPRLFMQIILYRPLWHCHYPIPCHSASMNNIELLLILIVPYVLILHP